MNRAIVLLLPLLACACSSSQFYPLEGMPVAIGESVQVGSLVAAPQRVVEDSRCPVEVQCITAGRVVVATQLTGDGWSETVPLTLGEPYVTPSGSVTLVSVRPERYSERRRPRREFRFVYEGA